jgi:iron complex transport system substrate-binding protein
MKTTIRYSILTLMLLMALILSACAPDAPAAPTTPAASPTPASITLTDGLGKPFTFDQPVQKIVSLAPSNTEILFAIGAGDQVVARDAFSDYPEAAKQTKDIGGGWVEIDTEAIVALAPDLILAAEINPVEQVKALEDLGLKVYYLSNPKDLDGMYENLRTVALLTGHEDETETLIESLKSRVAAIDAKIAEAAEKPVVFYELDGTDPNAPWTSGPGTYVDLLLIKAGGANLGNLLDSPWAQISLENLVTENPDVILLGDAVWGGVTPEAVAARAGWESLAAVKNARVFPFDDNLISRPGPRMVDGLEQLARLLHPELFR